ncbi:ribose 5-phosphate isomerase A [Carnobacterium maltaromaticum]|uniref:ribose-5-phosphate isomerase RpiA n=1 Tax=Carnobacterium maltaromaticum TaxID=2751 RepID=UPI000C75F5EE|nr:ribose-5-phosphate isomerase RpiA [Carnobacterium maltaromaticum]PLS32636.1 ribose 5-phosphate isomerase A [Carnobacterium maltaromaticum]PLS32816.1 ribose 5-phosphate isomerase A [Carnobacterium maltaromaticum]PLS33401.1 ribose 5-phosphate isomerase A [Carnobacterium maltaromaticum]PLS40803.1 ribose 5-phosphate isomerase A [Carnobacterium maltaromaticum]PLS41200.1 ribose 5-phosphate isomerase A [Carnobacterium maltaromaticum]
MNLKQMVGEKAAEYVKEGMVVGLGTGSTAYYMVEAVGKMVKEGLTITGVTTSNRTAEQAKALGIPLKSVDEVDHIDITIDGSDEISSDFQGIKGGGGALLFEKIVATYSDKVIWIVDESKMVEELGAFPLPVEVMEYGSLQLFRLFEEKGYKPTFRLNEEGQKYETDGGHLLIDLHLNEIKKPFELAEFLDGLTGVVEHGLFLDCVNTIIVGYTDGPKIIEAR